VDTFLPTEPRAHPRGHLNENISKIAYRPVITDQLIRIQTVKTEHCEVFNRRETQRLSFVSLIRPPVSSGQRLNDVLLLSVEFSILLAMTRTHYFVDLFDAIINKNTFCGITRYLSHCCSLYLLFFFFIGELQGAALPY